MALMPAGAHATLAEGNPEFYANFVRVEAHNGVFAVGPQHWNSPALEVEIECLNQYHGAIWNEGTPSLGRGQILGWEASGDASPTGTELNRKCKFKKGTAEVELWMTDEPGLVQTGTQGKRGEPLSVPWNVEMRCGEREEERVPIIRIGKPNGAAASPGCKTEAVELEEMKKEEEERHGCYASPVPAGCIKLDMVSPSLGLEQIYEGTLRPSYRNGFGTGLNPSKWVFEGEKSGKLRLSTAFATVATNTGSDKGFAGVAGLALVQAR